MRDKLEDEKGDPGSTGSTSVKSDDKSDDKSGPLQIYEAKKKWKEVHCKVHQDNFSYSKVKQLKTTLNLLNYTWYLGCEHNLSPPTRLVLFVT